MKDYTETLDYLYGLESFGIVLGLDNVRWILGLIGNPQDSFRAVHVAGTNGKGSVASMISTTLTLADHKTGAYTSPHLVSFTERITVDGEPITESEVVRLTRVIEARIEEQDEKRPFTFFDFTTALAFEYFRNQGVDVAVVEVGLGGRLDSTNVVEPLVSIITNVGLDHQDYLGNTIEEIAGEKAGIVKKGVPVVTGAEGPALGVIRDAASGRTDLYVLGEDFTFAKKGERVMSYRGIGASFDALPVGLSGDHQLANASLAVCALEVLASRGLAIGEEHIRQGLATARWPARLELIPATPGRAAVLLDGAHNPDGAKTLAAFLGTHFEEEKKVLVFGVMKDKDFPRMLAELLPVVHHVILTKPKIARAALPADVAAYAPGAVVTDTVRDALGKAFREADVSGLVVVAGSFYTIGEVKQLLDEPV
jgi:dihydrofolate synthase / folylpolyglutamate synthase